MTTSTLIADSGGTKTDWLLRTGTTTLRFETPGLNPNYVERAHLTGVLKERVATRLRIHPVKTIEFYGAGCGTPGGVALMRDILREVFPESQNLRIGSDLELAARALFGASSGVAAILGTGTNCGYYDGHTLTRTTPSLGYVLGDEGSGSHLGRRLLQDYFYNKLSPHNEHWIAEKLPGGKDELIGQLYRKPGAGAYLATWARSVIERKDDAEMARIIQECLEVFVDHQIRTLKVKADSSVGFVGSIGYHLKEELSALLRTEGLRPARFLQRPLDGF